MENYDCMVDRFGTDRHDNILKLYANRDSTLPPLISLFNPLRVCEITHHFSRYVEVYVGRQ